MSDKKRVEKAPVKPIIPRKRETPIVKVVEPILEPIEDVKPKRTRTKVSEDKFVRYSMSDHSTNHKSITDKVAKGEIKMAYFAIDNDVDYFYYLVLKK